MKRQAERDHKVFGRIIKLAVFLLMLIGGAQAQVNTTDGTTSPGIAPGAPAGSYPLTEIEVLNIYNGNVSLRFPLVTVGGRGSAQHTVTLPVEQRWTVDHTSDEFTGDHYFPSPTWWYTNGRYVAGRLLARHVAGPCPIPSEQTYTLTRVTFAAPDGTEYELRDSDTDGEKRLSDCAFDHPHFNRHRVFKTTDGTAATFISDTDVIDFASVFATQMTGHLFLRDGTCYRFLNGDVEWIRDRNGNKISFTYNFPTSMTITDSLNRGVLIEYDVTDPSPYGLCDRITFKGFGEASRVIRISKKSLGELLRDTQPPIQTYLQLFPELRDAYQNDFNPFDKIASVWLPDGRRYQIFYNVYGEVARVILPTGGAIEYDWEGGVQGGSLSGVIGCCEIYRKVVRRRVYTDGSASSLIGKTTYSKIPFTSTSDVTVENKDASDTLISRSKHYFFSNAAFGITSGDPFRYPAWKEGKEYQTDALDRDTGATLLRRVTHTWVQRAPVGWYPGDQNFAPTNDPRITDTVTTLADDTPDLVSRQTFGYDEFNNVTDTCDYDFGDDAPGPLLRHAHTTYVVGEFNSTDYTTFNLAAPANSIHLRGLPLTQIINTSCTDYTTALAKIEFEYDNYAVEGGTNPNHAALISRSNISSHDDVVFTVNRLTRGNVTSVKRWIDSSSLVSTYQFYDVAGNVVKNKDVLGKLTQLDFSDRFGFPDDNEARGNTPPMELDGKTSFAFATKLTDALGHESYTQFDYHLGKPVNSEDVNQVVASFYYESGLNKLDRPVKVVTAANFTAARSQTLFTYDDAGRTITTASDLTTFGDGQLARAAIYDGLGRTVETREYEPGGSIRTTQTYDAMGRIDTVSNPFRSTTEDTYGLTVTSYDALSRATSVAAFDKDSNPTGTIATEYLGDRVTVTDQAGKKRRSVIDALGRLRSVREDPGGPLQAQTVYDYDVLNNLTLVTQGTQTRRFAYDRMSRLIFAANPEQNTSTDPLFTYNSEQWAVKYEYDAASNLKFKTDTRRPGGTFVKVTYDYDDLRRLRTRTYTDGTPTVTYNYDTATRGVGRLASVVTNNVSTTSYTAYDELGRTLDYSQQTAGQTYTMHRAYNRAGLITSETYPSGKVIQTEYDGAGRVAGVSRGGKYYAGAQPSDATNRIQYSPAGAVSKMKLGNGLWEHTDFNSRLQPKLIGLGATATTSGTLLLEYDFGTTANNGNVLSQKITAPTGGSNLLLTQNYTYDELNRLLTANEKVNQETNPRWTQTFGFDRWGNRTALTNTGELPPANQLAVDPATNRFSALSYDEAGNQFSDESSHPLTYDAENHQKSFTSGTITYNYSYDGDGRRVKREYNDGTLRTTLFVYNASGQLIAEYNSDPVPQVQGGGGVSYLTTDHLGSARVVTNSTGGIKARHDYLPYGEDVGSTVGSRSTVVGYNLQDGLRQKFTQKERDSESGLDYFLARYYSSPEGRFTSPDGVFVDQWTSDPQSWNLYVYGRNNPLVYVDPTGNDYVVFDENGKKKRIKDNELENYELIEGDGDYAIFKDKNGKIWSGNFKDASQFATPAASAFAGFINGLTWPVELFARVILGEDRQQTRMLRSAQHDNPVLGGLGELAGEATLSSAAGAMAARSLSGETTTLGISRGPDRVIINHSHGGRAGRTSHVGTQAEIDAAIKADLRAKPPSSGGPQPERTISVNGKPLTYRPFVDSKGTVRVGTYFDPTRGRK